MISLMIAFQYIVSFLVPGVVNLPVTSGTNANPLSVTALLIRHYMVLLKIFAINIGIGEEDPA